AKGVRVVGDPGVAGAVAETLDASDIILVPHAVSWEAQRDLLEAAAACEIPAVRLAPGFYHLLAAGTRPFEANHVPLLSIERLRITGVDAALKTTLDYGIALLALPVLAMMAACLWLAARLSGGGAIVERGPAFGLRSRPFELLALAPPPDETPPGALGAWSWRLRRAAADGRVSKLANVLNVLTGRMSLVGPRALPASPVLLQRPWVPTLLLVRPGLTGPCHPNGARWSLEEQAIPDVAYVRDYSLWLDLRLLFRSFLRTVRRERALPASYQPAEGALAEPTGR
ncbi:MAG: sugar transferase, partial [Dehalococcoidia bacterium]|nr:sugar transferase [Dehalococcoidia bacterium]